MSTRLAASYQLTAKTEAKPWCLLMSSEYNWSDIFFKAVHLNASHGSTGSLDGCDTEGDPSEAEPSSDDGCESKLEDSSRECNKAPLIDLVCCSVLA